MNRSIRILILATYLQLLNYSRIKQAVFFSVMFPVLIFVLFGNIWGHGDSAYLFFLLTGVITATTASEGLFATGPVIKQYFNNNLIKFFRNLPFSVILHFLGMFFSRIGVMLLTFELLLLSFVFLFGGQLTLSQVAMSLLGMGLGFILFSFIGLLLSFYGREESGRGGLTGLLYFFMLFTTDVYYPVSTMNPLFGKFTFLFPTTYLLKFMRGDWTFLLPVLAWVLVPAVLFYYVFNHTQVKR